MVSVALLVDQPLQQISQFNLTADLGPINRMVRIGLKTMKSVVMGLQRFRLEMRAAIQDDSYTFDTNPIISSRSAIVLIGTRNLISAVCCLLRR